MRLLLLCIAFAATSSLHARGVKITGFSGAIEITFDSAQLVPDTDPTNFVDFTGPATITVKSPIVLIHPINPNKTLTPDSAAGTIELLLGEYFEFGFSSLNGGSFGGSGISGSAGQFDSSPSDVTLDDLCSSSFVDTSSFFFLDIFGVPQSDYFALSSVTVQGGVEIDDSPGSFGDWLTANGLTGNDALPTAVLNYEGIPNAIAYSLGIDPVNGISGGVSPLPDFRNGNPENLVVILPNPPPSDATYVIEEKSDLSEESWTEIARRVGSGSWTGSAVVTEGRTDAESTEFLISSLTRMRGDPRGVMRLKVILPN
ncbi:MAG: hypothetical protein AAGA58_04155 [Verrucomicrobiota bacterium]